VTIFASGGLDEDAIAEFVRVQAPIDGFGVGTTLTTSSDTPVLDCVYKLQEYAGAPRRKRSANKATWPGSKQVWRHYGADGRMVGDRLALDTGSASVPAGSRGLAGSGEPLLQVVMENGRRLRQPPSLDDIRQSAKRELERLPEPLRRLEPGTTYAVEVADELKELAVQVDRRLEIQAARSRS